MDLENELEAYYFARNCLYHSRVGEVKLNIKIRHQVETQCFKAAERNEALIRIRRLESLYSAIELYIWLAYRFEDVYPDLDLAMVRREQCSEEIGKLLRMIKFVDPEALAEYYGFEKKGRARNQKLRGGRRMRKLM